jgi:hypothetical protein
MNLNLPAAPLGRPTRCELALPAGQVRFGEGREGKKAKETWTVDFGGAPIVKRWALFRASATDNRGGVQHCSSEQRGGEPFCVGRSPRSRAGSPHTVV